jgi:hypothetical protein
MNRSNSTGFSDRLSAAAEAKKAQLERAARTRSEAESPTAVERRAARQAVGVARDARIAERRAAKLAMQARQAAALAAEQLAEAAAREAALKAEHAAGRSRRSLRRPQGSEAKGQIGSPIRDNQYRDHRLHRSRSCKQRARV